jgi:hypothetical protein
MLLVGIICFILGANFGVIFMAVIGSNNEDQKKIFRSGKDSIPLVHKG